MYNKLKFSHHFSRIQEAPWYRAFLQPVMDQVAPQSRVLDVGTGSGKMLQWLVSEKQVVATGLDSSNDMLREARHKLAGSQVELLLVQPGKPWPLPATSFEVVTICNVLFNLSLQQSDQLLAEAIRVLLPGGKMLILTPTGRGLNRLLAKYLSPANLSMLLWFLATAQRARTWATAGYLAAYAEKHGLAYSQREVFDGLAQLEVIS